MPIIKQSGFSIYKAIKAVFHNLLLSYMTFDYVSFLHKKREVFASQGVTFPVVTGKEAYFLSSRPAENAFPANSPIS